MVLECISHRTPGLGFLSKQVLRANGMSVRLLSGKRMILITFGHPYPLPHSAAIFGHIGVICVVKTRKLSCVHLRAPTKVQQLGESSMSPSYQDLCPLQIYWESTYIPRNGYVLLTEVTPDGPITLGSDSLRQSCAKTMSKRAEIVVLEQVLNVCVFSLRYLPNMHFFC